MKKILLLVHAPQKRPGHMNWTSFRDAIAGQLEGEITVDISALSQLTFLLDGDRTSIRDIGQGYDVADFDLVVFRTIGERLEEAIAVAAYCRKLNIRYIDHYIPAIGNKKLGCAFVRWEHGIPVPKTAYGPLEGLVDVIDSIKFPAVLKADDGKKGRDNYLVNTADEIERYSTEVNAPRFVLQNFIPNDGDFRILVLNEKAVMAIRRKATGDSHLNNTSQGGVAENIPVATLAEEVVDLAINASRLEKLAISGVDIVIDKNTGRPYVLEVNRAPQIATGGFAEQKLDYYVEALKQIVNEEEIK